MKLVGLNEARGFCLVKQIETDTVLLSVSNWRKGGLELWIWGNGLDFIECEIVRVWEGLREQAKDRETETKEMKTEEMRKSEKGRRRREWEAMSIRALGVWVWVSVSESTNWRRVETEQVVRVVTCESLRDIIHILPISLPPLDFLFILHYNRWFKLGFDATVTGHIMVSFTSSIPFILNFILWWTVDAGVGKVWALGLGLGSGHGMSCSVLTWWTATLPTQMSSLLFIFLL